MLEMQQGVLVQAPVTPQCTNVEFKKSVVSNGGCTNVKLFKHTKVAARQPVRKEGTKMGLFKHS